MKTKYLTIRISEDDRQRIKADAVKAKLSLTDYVLGKLNVPTIVPTEDLTVLVDSPNVPTGVPTNVPTLKKDAPVHAVKDELNKQLKDTPFTATIETIEKIDKLTLENLAGKGRKTAGSTIETYGENEHTIEDVPTKPSYYVMAENVRTKPINIKSTEKITIEGEKPVNLCAICKAPVKKGFLCKDCLSTK